MGRDSRDYPFLSRGLFDILQVALLFRIAPFPGKLLRQQNRKNYNQQGSKKKIDENISVEFWHSKLHKNKYKNCKHLMKKQNKNHFTSEESVECISLTATSKYKRNLYKFPKA